MQISVPGRSPTGLRTVSAWMNCTDGAMWTIKSYKIMNALVDVYADGKKVAVFEEGIRSCASNKTEEVLGKCKAHIRQKHGTHNMKFVLRIKNQTERSRAVMELAASGLDTYVDQCMGRKFCLTELGAETKESFKLRQSATTQLQCMLGKIPQSLPKLQRVCSEWQECLSKRGHAVDDLTQSLKVTILKKESDELDEYGALEEYRADSPDVPSDSRATGARANDMHCLDPESADPEELQCECLQTCERLSGSNQGTCIRNLLCDHCGVCKHWKQGRCTEKQITKCDASALDQRRSMQVTAIGTTLDDINTLDDTLTGKCSQ